MDDWERVLQRKHSAKHIPPCATSDNCTIVETFCPTVTWEANLFGQHMEREASMRNVPRSLLDPPTVKAAPPEASPGLDIISFERRNLKTWPMLSIDNACKNKLGLSAAQLCTDANQQQPPTAFASLMDSDTREHLHKVIQEQLQQQSLYLVSYTVNTANGQLHLKERGELIVQDGQPVLRGYLLIDLPLTPELGSWPIQFRDIERNPRAVVIFNKNAQIEYVNPDFTRMTAYTAAEMHGQPIRQLIAADAESQALDIEAHFNARNNWQVEFNCRRKDQPHLRCLLSVSRRVSACGRFTYFVGTYEDVGEHHNEQENMDKLAFTDPLTGLDNRYGFIRELEQHCANSGRTVLGLLLVDIDNFKRINDSMGNDAGDQLLASLAERLRSSVTGNCVMARIASNEFAILLDGFSTRQCQAIGLQILHTLEMPLTLDNQQIGVTASIGLAIDTGTQTKPQALMRHAGLALHKAKANGKNQLHTFTPELHTAADYKQFVENNLRLALGQDALKVFYQPKFCLKRGRLVGLEALLRWYHPQKGLINPDQFIGVAEETGMIVSIGKWVARQACKMSAQLRDAGFVDLPIAINMSPRQFADPDLVDCLKSILMEEQMPAKLLEIELTENLLLEATHSTHTQLAELKKLGITLAMDDFGTGYSSLSYLKKFPIDVIKIDRSFIKDIPQSKDDREITSAVIAMAHKLKLTVVAEGIETQAQLKFLRDQRCDIGQGYLFDPPISGSTLITHLQHYTTTPKR